MAQLDGMRALLEDFKGLLEAYKPGSSKNFSKCFKALLWALKDGSRGNILDRMERHKSSLEIVFLGLAMYSSVVSFV